MKIEDVEIKLSFRVIEWKGDDVSGYVTFLDETLLPREKKYVDCCSEESVVDAIKRLVVRGAPAIGIAGAYGLIISLQGRSLEEKPETFLSLARTAADRLNSARPTAVNLSWALECVFSEAKNYYRESRCDTRSLLRRMWEKAVEIHREDTELCRRIGENAFPIFEKYVKKGVLTHCNAGALATAGIGTATAGMYLGHALGMKFRVFCDETRPLLQGSRLTAWELKQAGMDVCVITDSTAPVVLREGNVDMIIVGADRVAANGDVANKIGTFGLALAAHSLGVPFFVALPYSSFDQTFASGNEIPIELRSPHEVSNGLGIRTAPEDVDVYSPAFDITPHWLISGIITDRGVCYPPFALSIKEMI